MGKLDALKTKLREALAKVKAKLDSIAFLQKLRPSTEVKAKNPNSFFSILASGNFWEKLQAYSVILLLLIGLSSGSFAGIKLFLRLYPAKALKEQDARYSKGFDNLQDHAREAASVVSIGKILINGYGPQKKGLLSLDLWARCDSPESAAYAQSNDVMMHDKAIDVLNSLSLQHEDFMNETTKEKARIGIRDAMNTIMKHGKVEDVFFHNLLIQ